jgi:hypothetical protein
MAAINPNDCATFRRFQQSIFALWVSVVAISATTGHFHRIWPVGSFYWSDLPSLPKYLKPSQSVMMGHYFGDFLQIVSMSRQVTPYADFEGIPPSQYPPLNHFLVLPFTFLGHRLAFVCWVAVVVGFLVIATNFAVNQGSRGKSLSALLFSTHYVSALDRGNLILLCLPFLIFATSSRLSQSQRAISLAIAVSIKPYLIVAAPALRPETNARKWLLQFAIAIATLNFMSILFFEGSWLSNLRGLFSGVLKANDFPSARFNHSFLSNLPLPLALLVMICGLLGTIAVLFRVKLNVETRLALGMVGCLAFSPQLPPYQLVFLLVPIALSPTLRNLPRPTWHAYSSITILTLVPKQIVLGPVNLAVVDGLAILTLWLVLMVHALKVRTRCR